MHTLRSIVAAVLTAAVSHAAYADFIVPDAATAPFEDWSRGDGDSFHAQWEVFTTPVGSPGNAPDAGSSSLGGDARVVGNEPTAFVTSGGNIYSFADAIDFTLTSPHLDRGSGWNTRVVLQLRTQGTALDLDSLQLIFDDGDGDVTLNPVHYDEVYAESLGGFGGALVDHLFVFDILAFNPASFSVDFAASGSSMSLDRVLLDTFTTTAALSAVPEPASVALLALGGLAMAQRRRGA